MKKLPFITFLFFQVITLNLFSQQFTEQTDIILTGVSQGSVAWSDYDKDGYQDFLLTGWSDSGPVAKIYHNNGSSGPGFTEKTSIILTGVFQSSVAWCDYDNDGDPDILLTGTTTGNSADAVSKIYRNDGGGVFTEITSGLPGVYFGSVAWGDYDNDGLSDILITGLSDSAERISKIFRNNGNGKFTEVNGTSFTGVIYGSASWGDYDNDGFLDVLLTGQTTSINRISKIYHNNGGNSFTELTNVQLRGAFNSNGSWGDYNNDGYLDIILTGEDVNFKNNTTVYLNNHDNSFTEQTGIVLTGVKKGSVLWGDYNNDGNLDIFLSGNLTNNSTAFKIYTNQGNNTFTENSSIVIPSGFESNIAFCDYDNDGDLDFVYTGQDGTGTLFSKVYRNNCIPVNHKPGIPANLSNAIDGTTALLKWNKASDDLTSPKSISYNIRIGATPTTSEYISPLADINGFRQIVSMGNAQLDTTFVFRDLRWNTHYYASVQAIDNSYLGGGFSSPTDFAITPLQPTHLTASNINTTSLLLKWKRGNGDKCILFAKEGTSGPSSPVNNTTYYSNSVFGEGAPLGTTGWFCIYKGEADSVIVTGLAPEKDYTVHAIEFEGSAGSENYATVTNVNNDNLGVFSSGIFTNLTGISMVGLRKSSVAWGDYDNDGYLDILLTGQNLAGIGVSKIYRNNGDNTFTDQTGISLAGVYFGSVAWGDYNNDDLIDIIISGYNNDAVGPITKLYKNNGNNTFSEQTGISFTGVYNSSVAWGDLDNDGDLDLIISGNTLEVTPVTKIYLNNGNNTFTDLAGLSLTGVNNGSVMLGDYDNDGDLDIMLSGLDVNANPVSKIYKNNGNNSYTLQTNIPLTGVSYSSMAWGDYDNDGYLDIVLMGASGTFPNFNWVTKVYHNNGDNTFTELSGTSFVGVYNGSVSWGDYNNDGLLDILLMGDTGSSYIFKIYLNSPNHVFVDQTQIQLPGTISCSASSADYDSDGDLDILVSGYTGALSSKIYRNNLYMMAGKIKPNMRPAAPTGLKSEITPSAVKLTWGGIATDETTIRNMSYNIRCKLKNDPRWKIAPQATSTGFRSINNLGNAQLNRDFIIRNPSSGTYLWQVQAVDQSYSGSTWSGMDSVIIKNTQAFFKTDTVCLGLPTHSTDQSVVTEGIASWKWDLKDGNSSAIQNPVHIYTAAGIYAVKLLVVSNGGDKDSLTQNVIVKARPTTQFTAPNVCVGTATQITNTSSLNGLTISSWLWRFGDLQSATTEQPVSHFFSLKGTYKTFLKAISLNGCSDSITKDIIIAGYPGSSVSADKKLTLCQGDTVTLSSEADPLYTYQWKMDNTYFTNATQSSFKVLKDSAAYSVKITNTLANCITYSESKTVVIKTTPAQPAIISDNYKTGDCLKNLPIKIKIDQISTGIKYHWSRNAVPFDNPASTYLEGFLEPGIYSVKADLNGCQTESKIFDISYQGAPEKPVISAHGPTIWLLSCNGTAQYYKWYLNGNLVDDGTKNFYVANRKFGIYMVSAGNTNGCYTRSDTIRIPTFNDITGIEDLDPFTGLKIYPNPTPGVFTIEMDNNLFGEMNIRISNQDGREVLNIKFEKSVEHFSSQIDLSGQGKGVYLINLLLNKYIANRKIVVQ